MPTPQLARGLFRHRVANAALVLAVLGAVLIGSALITAAAKGPGASAGRHHLRQLAAVAQTRAGRAGGRALPPPVGCRHCWRPALRERWQIQLSSTPKRPYPKVGLIEVDGFDTPARVVKALRAATHGGGVVCYIDAGTWENWRPDASRFPRSLLGQPDGSWAGERWLDIARFPGALARIMANRARMCKRKGFNAIDFDNVDGYTNSTGFHLTGAEQLRYDVFLANTAHRLGLAVALKNDLEQIPRLVKYFDFAVDEQCFQYRECLSSQNGGFGLDEFTRAHKAVFDIEYRLKTRQFCPGAIRDRFNGLRKRLNLGPWSQACR